MLFPAPVFIFCLYCTVLLPRLQLRPLHVRHLDASRHPQAQLKCQRCRLPYPPQRAAKRPSDYTCDGKIDSIKRNKGPKVHTYKHHMCIRFSVMVVVCCTSQHKLAHTIGRHNKQVGLTSYKSIWDRLEQSWGGLAVNFYWRSWVPCPLPPALEHFTRRMLNVFFPS